MHISRAFASLIWPCAGFSGCAGKLQCCSYVVPEAGLVVYIVFVVCAAVYHSQILLAVALLAR